MYRNQSPYGPAYDENGQDWMDDSADDTPEALRRRRQALIGEYFEVVPDHPLSPVLFAYRPDGRRVGLTDEEGNALQLRKDVTPPDMLNDVMNKIYDSNVQLWNAGKTDNGNDENTAPDLITASYTAPVGAKQSTTAGTASNASAAKASTPASTPATDTKRSKWQGDIDKYNRLSQSANELDLYKAARLFNKLRSKGVDIKLNPNVVMAAKGLAFAIDKVVTKNGSITSKFGYRNHPIEHRWKLHTGVDIAAPIGTNVLARFTGKVIFAGQKRGYGNVIIIDHGDGLTTLYAHLSKIGVNVGKIVNTGDAIGNVGQTGGATGPHLHFELRENGVPENPEN